MVKQPLRNRRRRAYALMWALLVVFMVVSLILGVALSQTNAARLASRAQHNLQVRQLAAFKDLQIRQGSQAGAQVPAWLGDSGSTTTANATLSNWSQQLFATANTGQWKLPDLRQANAGNNTYPGQNYTTTRLKGSQAAYQTVATQFLPYAIYAANGKVNGSDIAGWKNPLQGESKDPINAYSSSAPWVYGAGLVYLASLKNGLAFSPANIYPNTDLKQLYTHVGVAYCLWEGQDTPGFPKQALVDGLHSDLTDLNDAIAKSAQDADRRMKFFDQISIGDTVALFFPGLGGNPQRLAYNMSVAESVAFPLPVIPSIAPMFDIIYLITLNAPYSPDGALDSDWSKQAMQQVQDIMDLLKPIKDVLEEIEALQAKIAKMSDWDPLKYPLEVTLATLQVSLEALLAPMYLAVGVLVDPFELELASSGKRPVPASRNEEARAKSNGSLSSDGAEYWPYRDFWDRITDIFKGLLSGNFSGFAEATSGNVTLTFFGQKNKVQKWDFKKGLQAHASLTVPRGTVFALSGGSSHQISGDLWLQRGSLCVVNGDLTLSAGDNGTTGRIFLEEGAVLKVAGDLTVGGDAARGSVVLGGPNRAVHPITSAISVQGNLNLPFGSTTGLSLDEIADPTGSQLSSLSQFLRPLLNWGALNFSRLDGPFHRRLPYLSQYGAVIAMIDLEAVVLPFPIPMQNSNIDVFIFRIFSNLFQASLNQSVGPNFLTHCDWWGSAEEATTLRPKVDLYDTLRTLRELNFGTFSTRLSDFNQPFSDLNSFIDPKKISDMQHALSSELLSQMVGFLPEVEELPVGDIIGKLIHQFSGTYDVEDQENKLDELATSVSTKATLQSMNELWDAIEGGGDTSPSAQAQEVAGALFYAGGSLTVGSQAPLMSGWLVAEDDIVLKNPLTIGSCFSFSGDIQCQSLRYYAPFTQGNFALPASGADGGFKPSAGVDPTAAQPAQIVQVGNYAPIQVSSGWTAGAR